MSLEFHPNAADAIDRKGLDLLSKVIEYPIVQREQARWSQRPVTMQIRAEDLIGEFHTGEVDGFRRPIASYFFQGDHRYGLAEESYQELKRLGDEILKARPVNDCLSRRFVEEAIFAWCKANFGSHTTSKLTDHLISRASAEIQQFTVWVPIAHLEVQNDFELGKAKVQTITNQMLDEEERIALEHSPNQAEKISAAFEKWRSMLQGCAAVVCTVEAERKRALERTLETAEAVIGLLRVFSIAAYTPWLFCPCAIFGSEYLPKTVALTVVDEPEHAFSLTERRSHANAQPWSMSAAELEDMYSRGLTSAGALVEESGLSDFRRKLRTSILAYSKGVTLPDIADRLVYTLSALEGLLLRDGSEPITQNLGERMAFLINNDAEARQGTVKNVKAIYEIRSRYIHHRNVSVENQEALDKFFAEARHVLYVALQGTDRFHTAQQFLAAIDQIKFG